MIEFINDKKIKNPQIFSCKKCDLITYNKKDYNRHLETQKHLATTGCKMQSKNKDFLIKHYICNCGKQYKENSGLWRHKKICIVPINNISEIDDINKFEELEICEITQDEPQENNFSDSEIIKMISEFKNIITDSNSEFKNMIMDLVKTIATTSNNINNNTNNNTINTINANNTTFNLQFFLDEQCKDALNIDEFVDSIKMQISDLEITGRHGYVHGITEIINKNLNELDKFKRPIHCSDLKREVLYVKNNNIWTKENKENSVLTKAVKQIAHKNIQQIAEWKNAHPGCTLADSRKNDLYLKIVSNAMSGSSFEEQHTNYGKIISNVAKKVVIIK
jgi:uncharacterized C2H2 Zn-finger protein